MTSGLSCGVCRGYIRTAAQRFLIEPLSGDDQGDHAVVTLKPDGFTPGVCGVTNTSWSSDFEPPTGRSRSRSVRTPLGTRRGRSSLTRCGLSAGQQHPASAEVPGALPGRGPAHGRTEPSGPAADQLIKLVSFQFQKMKRDQEAVRKRMFEIVNFVNMVTFGGRGGLWGG